MSRHILDFPWNQENIKVQKKTEMETKVCGENMFGKEK